MTVGFCIVDPYVCFFHVHAAVPSAVKDLILNITEDQFMIHWASSLGVVSYYVVIVTVNGKELQFNVTALDFTLPTENLSEGGAIEVNVRAVNDAGIGPSATAITVFEHTRAESKYSVLSI